MGREGRRVGEGGERGREGKEAGGEGTPRKNLTNPALLTWMLLLAEFLPLYNPANRKIRVIFGKATFRHQTKFMAKIRLQHNVYG